MFWPDGARACRTARHPGYDRMVEIAGENVAPRSIVAGAGQGAPFALSAWARSD